MDQKHRKLISLGQKLYQAGLVVESARADVRRLNEAGLAYDSREMTDAVLCYQEKEAKFRQLEQEYLQLRAEL